MSPVGPFSSSDGIATARKGLTVDAEVNLLSLQTVAERLAVTSRTVRRLIERRELTAVRVGSQWRVSDDALADYIARNTKPANPA